MTEEFAVVPIVDGVADLSVLHEPADPIDEAPLAAASKCGIYGYVYLRAGMPGRAAVCAVCAAVKVVRCGVEASASRYVNGGCRCEDCRRAHTEYRRAHWVGHPACVCPSCGGVKSPKARVCKPCRSVAQRTTPVCGTNANYWRGCRCDECRAAHGAACAEWRARKAAA